MGIQKQLYERLVIKAFSDLGSVSAFEVNFLFKTFHKERDRAKLFIITLNVYVKICRRFLF